MAVRSANVNVRVKPDVKRQAEAILDQLIRISFYQYDLQTGNYEKRNTLSCRTAYRT